MTYSVCARVGIPVVGMGGVESGRDAADFMAAGACCIAVGTASFRDPAAGARVANELGELLAQRRLGSVRDAVGAARRSPGV
jgi:dihydroorotate dehydrogenase (NAD+) catalytic subunit